jgi:hypothetical protein
MANFYSLMLIQQESGRKHLVLLVVGNNFVEDKIPIGMKLSLMSMKYFSMINLKLMFSFQVL